MRRERMCVYSDVIALFFFWRFRDLTSFFLSSRGQTDAAVVTASHFIPVILLLKTTTKIRPFLVVLIRPE
jgi:hypothetical protein